MMDLPFIFGVLGEAEFKVLIPTSLHSSDKLQEEAVAYSAQLISKASEVFRVQDKSSNEGKFSWVTSPMIASCHALELTLFSLEYRIWSPVIVLRT